MAENANAQQQVQFSYSFSSFGIDKVISMLCSKLGAVLASAENELIKKVIVMSPPKKPSIRQE